MAYQFGGLFLVTEITFSFCRLFENCPVDFLSEIINAVKKNSSLKTLRLPGNRLGMQCKMQQLSLNTFFLLR